MVRWEKKGKIFDSCNPHYRTEAFRNICKNTYHCDDCCLFDIRDRHQEKANMLFYLIDGTFIDLIDEDSGIE